MPIKDLTGKKFGKLIVLNYTGRSKNRSALFLCQCDCGNQIEVRGVHLSNGHTKSCGCLHKETVQNRHKIRNEELLGKKFGKLTVTKFIEYDDKKNAIFKCTCQCGNTVEVYRHALISKDTKSCGCLHTLPKGEASFNKLYYQYKYHAEKRGYTFELTRQEVKELINKNCFYCGISPYNELFNDKYTNGSIIYNGIDRIDNTQGYIASNVVSSCVQCNRSKRDYTLEDFTGHISRVYNNFINPKLEDLIHTLSL